MSQRAIFLDRDGVINVDHGYVSRPDEVEFIPGAREMIAELSRQGWLIFVVTNQSGVARGMYTEEDVQALHRWLNEEFAKAGGKVTEFFYCPHLLHAKVKKYDVDCVCRKPRPGMIIQALSKHRIAREDAFLNGMWRPPSVPAFADFYLPAVMCRNLCMNAYGISNGIKFAAGTYLNY